MSMNSFLEVPKAWVYVNAHSRGTWEWCQAAAQEQQRVWDLLITPWQHVVWSKHTQWDRGPERCDGQMKSLWIVGNYLLVSQWGNRMLHIFVVTQEHTFIQVSLCFLLMPKWDKYLPSFQTWWFYKMCALLCSFISHLNSKSTLKKSFVL